VVETIRHDGFSATAGALVNDECNLLWQQLILFLSNTIIKKLTKWPMNYQNASKLSCIWFDDPPSFILEALVNDATIFPNQ
jgi:hypothetical protein